MSKVRDRMKNAFDKQPSTPPAESKPLSQSKVAATVKEVPKTERPPAPPAQKPIVAKQVTVPVDTPTPVKQIARSDLDISTYGVKPVATNFNCYNRELWNWLTTFSSNNRFNGGSSITKSQLMEISLDVIMYDLGINPIGYESQQELREAIQNRIRETN